MDKTTLPLGPLGPISLLDGWELNRIIWVECSDKRKIKFPVGSDSHRNKAKVGPTIGLNS